MMLRFRVNTQGTDIQGTLSLEPIVNQIDSYLDRFVQSRDLPPQLDDAIRYSLLHGGKRVRPLLAWFSATAVGGQGESALHAGGAVEMIHAFSLIHDDLPALDNDDLRRGRPTLHKHAGEAIAILAGDALLSLAYESAMAFPDGLVSIDLCHELAVGTRSMIVGQVYDTLGGLPDELSAEEQVELIHRNKTGALLRASCRMGAMSAGASEDSLKHVTAFSEAIGLQFQVVDDILDVEGCPEQVGKATGKDADAGKRTFPGVLGMERSRTIAKELGVLAQESLSHLEESGDGSVEGLRMLGEMLVRRTN